MSRRNKGVALTYTKGKGMTAVCSKCGNRQLAVWEFCSRCGTSMWGAKKAKRKKNPVRRSNPASNFFGLPWWLWLVGGAAVLYLVTRKKTVPLLTAPTPTLTTDLPGMDPQLDVPGLTPGTQGYGFGRYGSSYGSSYGRF